jgi:hypothetical protein
MTIASLKRRKRAPYIYTNDRLHEQFMDLIYGPGLRDRMYVYRIVNETPTKPALYVGTPISWIEEHLQRDHGGGDFLVMIRRGEKMMLVGEIGIEPLPQKRQMTPPSG